jgi:hypothetical protein
MFLIGDGSVGGEGRAALGCRSAFGAGGGVGWWIVGYMEVLVVGIGLIVTSTFGIGVDRFKRNKERSAMTGKTMQIRMRTSPSLVIRK